MRQGFFFGVKLYMHVSVIQVSALVTMYTHEEDIDSAIDVFTQAIQYYQSEQVRLRT